MRFLGVLLVRRALADAAVHDDQRWLRLRLEGYPQAVREAFEVIGFVTSGTRQPWAESELRRLW